jgi:hypothetical protein
LLKTSQLSTFFGLTGLPLWTKWCLGISHTGPHLLRGAPMAPRLPLVGSRGLPATTTAPLGSGAEQDFAVKLLSVHGVATLPLVGEPPWWDYQFFLLRRSIPTLKRAAWRLLELASLDVLFTRPEGLPCQAIEPS